MKNFLLAGLLLVLVGAGVAYFMYNKPHEDMASAQVDHTLEASALFAEFEADEAAANAKYLDQVIQVTGKIINISKTEEGNVSLTLESGSDMFGVICELDNFSKQKETHFQEGQTVTLKGICTGMLMDVVLVRCVPAS